MLFLSGVRIPEVNEIRHLGVIFDSKLTWKKQIESVARKAERLRNLFRILCHTKHGPDIPSLRTLYISLVRSRLEYGIIAFGSTSKARKQKIESVQNGFLRTILGAPKTTPIREMQCELMLEPLRTRRIWLAGRYLIRVDHQGPSHPLYSMGREFRAFRTSWKSRNEPALGEVAAHLLSAGIKPIGIGDGRRMLPKAPWTKSHSHSYRIDFKFFPQSKRSATSNPTAAVSLFHELIGSLQEMTLAYTDGSLCATTEKTAYATCIPALGV